MKKYKVKVNEVRTTIFEVEAKDRTEAKEMVEEIITASTILKMNPVRSYKKFGYEVRQVKN